MNQIRAEENEAQKLRRVGLPTDEISAKLSQLEKEKLILLKRQQAGSVEDIMRQMTHCLKQARPVFRCFDFFSFACSS